MSILNRTFHPDEANQAFTTGRLLETGTYTYNPQDHHGPTLYYAAATLQKAAGHHSTATLGPTLLRCTPLLFAVLALVFGALAVRKITGRIGHGILFALLLGTSPLFVFFATDFIQEMLLAAFTMMMLWSALGMLKSLKVEKLKSSALDVDRNSTTQPSTLNPQLPTTNCQLPTKIKPGTWALLFGIAAGLAFATKETVLLTFAAAGLAGIPFFWRIRKDVRLETRDVTLSVLGFALTAALFYSSFGTNWQGVYNAFIAAPLSYVHRAAGDAASQGAAAHVHPWWQYLEWLFFGKIATTHNSAGLHISGSYTNICAGAYVLFCCPIPLLFRRVRQFITPAILRSFTFLFLYTSLLLVIYSAIPYKTPWCALQIHLGYLTTCFLGFLIFGELIVGFSQWLARKDPTIRSCGWTLNPSKGRTLIVAVVASVLVGSVLLTEYVPQLIRMNRNPDSKDIPYNYASASPQVQDLATLIIDKIASSQKPTTNSQPSTLNSQLPSTRSTRSTRLNSKPQTLNSKLQTQNFFVAVALPPEDTWPLPFYLRSIKDNVGYWTQFGELEALAGLGRKPTVVVVPAEEGHLVQPLFPHLKNTKRFEMRPRVRVRAFW